MRPYLIYNVKNKIMTTVTVEYDETGFMTGDAQLIWDDAIASENAWETID